MARARQTKTIKRKRRARTRKVIVKRRKRWIMTLLNLNLIT